MMLSDVNYSHSQSVASTANFFHITRPRSLLSLHVKAAAQDSLAKMNSTVVNI